MPKRILILSVRAGAGHIRAAQALEEALKGRSGVEARNVDALAYTNAAFRRAFSRGYEKLARDLPSVWGLIYEKLEETGSKDKLKRLTTLFDKLNARPLRQMVKEFDPDHIVCTHYVPAEVLAERRLAGRLRATLSVVLTDYDIHAMWIQEGVDRYFVASEEMAYALRAQVTRQNAVVHVTGIPIMPEFAAPPISRAVARRQLGLATHTPAVLVSAGGFGLIRSDRVVAALADELRDVQFLAVAGRNEKLKAHLDAAAKNSRGRILPLGFVDNMHELMAASDFALAKTGGLTTSECLASGLPIVIFKPTPGQEERNATFVLERGAGVWAQTAAHAIFKVGQLVRDPERIERMRKAARCAARPRAANDIADIVLDGA